MLWQLKQQEQAGTYRFDGAIYVTVAVTKSLAVRELGLEVLVSMLQQVKDLVQQNNGADYLQVFVSDKGEKLFLIDNLNDEMKKEYPESENFATLMWSYEY